MKSQLKTEMAPVSYWTCSDPDHRHKSEEIALACIEKAAKSKRTRESGSAGRWGTQGYLNIFAEFKAGAKKSDLARKHGISPARIDQIISKAERISEESLTEDPLRALSMRIFYAIRGAGIETIEQLREAFENSRLEEVSNIGRGSLAEIRDFLYSLKNT